MNIPFIKKTYRVLEITAGDGVSKFYPQVRFLYFRWLATHEKDYRNIPMVCDTLADATDFLYDIELEIKRRTIVKKTKHPFNAVFHKLKQTDND